MLLYIVVNTTDWRITCDTPLSYEVAKELRDDLQWFADVADNPNKPATRYAIAQCITD